MNGSRSTLATVAEHPVPPTTDAGGEDPPRPRGGHGLPARTPWSLICSIVGALPRMALDVLATLIAFAATLPLAGRAGDAPGAGAGWSDRPALVAAFLAPVLLAASGAYARAPRTGGRMGRLIPVAVATVLAGWGLGATASGQVDILQTAAILLLLPATWAGVRILLPRRLQSERALLLGSGAVAERIIDTINRGGDAGLRITGILCDDAPGTPPSRTAPRRLGGIDDLDAALASGLFDRVIVAFTGRPDGEIARVLRACDLRGVPVQVVPRLFEYVGPEPQVVQVGSLALLEIGRRHQSRGERLAKRAVDVIGSLGLLTLLSPIIAIVAVIVMVDDGRPVIFRQTRVGLRGRPFEVWKFRTMVRDADAIGNARIAGLKDGAMSLDQAVAALKQPNDPRITRTGRFLRATSLDELPQLVNVLRGDMSLVGPRPLRDFEVRSLDAWERQRNDVRPGMTGLWQVEGRADVGWEERVQLDCSYVRHQSLRGDLRLLLRTVRAVLGRHGAV